MVVLAVLVLGAILFLGVGVDFWTDAIWYQSVGYASVFWTRVGTQWWLFAGVFVVALAVLLGNLWLAARMAPPPGTPGVPGGSPLSLIHL